MEINPTENNVGESSGAVFQLPAEQQREIDASLEAFEAVNAREAFQDAVSEGAALEQQTTSSPASTDQELTREQIEAGPDGTVDLGDQFRNFPNWLDQQAYGNESDYVKKVNTQQRAYLGYGVAMTDGAVDLLNLIPGVNIPKFTPFETEGLQQFRKMSSVIQMGFGFQRLGMRGLSRTKVGQELLKTRKGRVIAEVLVELPSSAATSFINEYEGEPGNIATLLEYQEAVPVPRWLDGMLFTAYEPGDSVETTRWKNFAENFLVGASVGAAFEGLGPAGKGASLPESSVKIEGASPKASEWVKNNTPEPIRFQEDYIIRDFKRQDEALDELGVYNQWINEGTNNTIPLRGVDPDNRFYNWNELNVRTVDDFGVVGASIDAARIARNYGTTYGRLRNMISEPALKYAILNSDASNEIILGLSKSLKDADQYTSTGPGWKIDFDQITKAGDDLVVDMVDPSMDVAAVRRLMEPYVFRNEAGVEILKEGGYAQLLGASKKMVEEYTGMTVARAQAYLNTSLAGQTADLAEGIRLNREAGSVPYAQERLRDNLQYMMKLKAQTNYYRNQKNGLIKLFERTKNIGKSELQVLNANFPQFQKNLEAEIVQFGNDLDYIFKEQPELGKALAEMMEATDGRVFTLNSLNETMANSFKNFRPFFETNPESPNLIGQAIRGNVMNSMLSSVETPAKALYGNLFGTMMEPFNMMAGAALRGDVKAMQSYWMAYTAFGDTLGKAFDFAGKMFSKAARNDPKLQSATDIDYSVKIDTKLKALRTTAEAQAANGDTGYLYAVQAYENMMRMSQHPAMRLSSNTMTGIDGLTQATFANAEARFRAMDAIRASGGKISREKVKRLATQHYNSMFDANGILVDEAVKYASDEIALRLDNPMAQALNEGSKTFPILRVGFPFPGTMTNIVKQFDDVAPIPYSQFQRDINDLAFLDTKRIVEDPMTTRRLLENRGYDVEKMSQEAQSATLIRIKDHVLGRKAITTGLMGLATVAFSQDRITGDGFYDKQKQMARQQNSNWKPRSIKGLDGKYYSWSNILPPGVENWVAGWINVLDNFDSLGEANHENLSRKFMFILSASLADDAGLSVVEPIVQILNGNEGALERWAAHQANNVAPLAGARRDLSNLVDSGLKLVEPEFGDMLLNRNRFVSPFQESLPQITNPLDGTKPNSYGFLQRLINKISPVKVHTGPSELGQFLQDIEYPSSMLFKTWQGVKLTTSERARLMEIAAEQKIWRNGVQRAKNLADARGTIKSLEEAQSKGLKAESINLSEFDQIHTEIDNARQQAERAAFEALNPEMRSAIIERLQEQKQRQYESTIGNILEQTPTR